MRFDRQPTLGQANDLKHAAHRRTARNPALDFTKGVLVLIMVLYHWLNVFVVSEFDVYRYLRFLTPSFIFITGFLISNAYLGNYAIDDTRLTKRLIHRGLKILGIFVLLNVATLAFTSETATEQIAPSWLLFVENLAGIFFTGNVLVPGQGKAVSFYILVPIGYLLLLSACLVMVYRRYAYVFHVVFIVFLLGIFALHVYAVESPNLELLAIGLLGVICGRIPIEKINSYTSHPTAVAFAYIGYVGAITVWNVRYPLQILGVCLSLMLIYWLGTSQREPGRLTRQIIVAGRYSLFAYIAQIAVLQLLGRGLRHVDLSASGLAISLAAALCLTMIAVEVMDRARSKASAIDRLYAAVFS